jgi:hypothetical protein
MKQNTHIGYSSLLVALVAAGLTACSTSGDDPFGDWQQPEDPFTQGNGDNNGGNGSATDDGSTPTFDSTITAWSGQTATDAADDVAGSDEDFYVEANKFKNTVKIAYSGSTATVESTSDKVVIQQTGAYVTVDMATNTVSGVEIIVSGKSDDGALKIYGSKKFKLTLNGVELTSQRGPAINSQCKKRIFVHVADDTTNRLTDPSTYTDDAYYLDASTQADEDRKGCFFSEGNLIFSGHGTLVVAGKKKHGICTDGYLWMRPGTTIAVTEAAKNAIHVKGDTDDGIGVTINGGLIYANVASTAGKAIKTDLDVNVNGGTLLLNTSGVATYDEDDKDTSSAACIKADGNITISGGELTLKSSGTGGKGLNADGNITVEGGTTTITTTGGKYYYTSSLTSSPKGVKADGNVTVSGGKLNISVTGKSDGSEGLESKATMLISGGETYVYAYDDAINASTAINITGGKVFAYALNNDGIDSNGSLTISGGTVIAVGASSPECGIDVDNGTNFKINGGTVMAIAGGSLQNRPSSASSQCSVEYSGFSLAKDKKVAVLDSSSTPLLTLALPKTLSGGSFFFSAPGLKSGSSYTVSTGGELTGYSESWNGWYKDGTWTNGTQAQSFTISSTVTGIGTSTGGMGGGQQGGGQQGGGGGWGWH